jgi:hypothetical protein
MATQKGTGLVERAVREALGTLVSPQICEQLIARSLATHGLRGIPEHGPQLGEWIEGGLRAEVDTAVGPDAAELLVGQLQPIAAYAQIAVPRTTRENAPAASAQKRRSAPPRAGPSIDPLSGARSLPLPELPSFDDDEHEPERPTNLRYDTSQEPDWEAQQVPVKQQTAAGAFGNTPEPRRNPFDSGPPTGMYQNKELSYSPTPEAPNTRPAVRTLPPDHSSDRPTHDALHTARPADYLPLGENLPVVLTATADPADLDALRRYLVNTASVVHIPDLVGLLDALEDGSLVEPIVLIDCQRPTVHVTSVAAIGEDLPKGTTVVLWGADDPTWSQIDRARMPACRWVRCSREATTDDVGSLCSMLLG